MLTFVLITVLMVLLAGALPVWPYSRKWGYSGATGIGGILLLIAVLLFYRAM